MKIAHFKTVWHQEMGDERIEEAERQAKYCFWTRKCLCRFHDSAYNIITMARLFGKV